MRAAVSVCLQLPETHSSVLERARRYVDGFYPMIYEPFTESRTASNDL